MRQTTPLLTRFLKGSSRMAGKPISFVLALSFVFFWIIVGFIFGFDNTWMLIINTIATIIAALMVFVIQNTQNRESKALHMKLDELIRATKEAENELIAIEEKEEEELEQIKLKLFQKMGDKEENI
ncbi:MAG: low affinity iron permease family protein [Chlamydiales bacterium]